MPINNMMLAAIKLLSYSDEYLIKDYRMERKLDQLLHPNLLKASYTMWDHAINRDGYDIPVRLFFPEEEKSDSLIIFFHGGGFVKGNIDSYSSVCAQLAKETKQAVLSVDYRLAPEYPFPIGLEDCYKVVQDIISYFEVYGIDKTRITLVGDSAGANLAATVSLMARDRGDALAKRQILIYPLTNNVYDETTPYPSVIENGEDYLLTTKRINNYIALYIQDKKDLANPYFAPLLAKDLSNQPDTLIITAQYDPLRDEGEAYGEALKRNGNYVEVHRIQEAIHGFFSLPPLFEPVKESYGLINQFLSRRTL